MNLRLRVTPLLGCLLLAACVPLRQYHTVPPDPAVPAVAPLDVPCFPEKKGCADAFLENRPEYLLGFVEFDDLGWSWDRNQQEIVLETLEAEVADGDALGAGQAQGPDRISGKTALSPRGPRAGRLRPGLSDARQ
jgi:hypothetical protein